MALEFTNIPDRVGPAIYLLGNGNMTLDTQLKELGEKIDQATPDETQVVLLDINRGDGIRVKEFYGVSVIPTIMIVMDDDTIPYQWTDTLPQPQEVSYQLSQINGSTYGA